MSRSIIPKALPLPVLRFLTSLAVALPLLMSSTASATTLISMEIDEVAARAELIFEGQVIAVASRADVAGTISTFITFEIFDVIKGDYAGDSLELKFLGGNVNGRITEVSGLRQPALDEVGVYFIESTSVDLVNPLLGWSQGHFLIQTDSDGVRRVSTSDQLPVTDLQPMSEIPALIKRPRQLISSDSDTAAGVITEASPLMIDQALSVEEFKSRIEELIEAQAQ